MILAFAYADTTCRTRALEEMEKIWTFASGGSLLLISYVVRYGSEPHVYLSRFHNITHVYRSWLTRDVKPLTFEYHIASFHPRGDINEW